MSPSGYFRDKRFFLLLLTVLLYLSGWYFRAERFGSITALTGFGCVREVVCFSELNSEFIPESPYIFPQGGYDGQFYFYTAASLFSDREPVFDDKLLRISRIGYPLLAGWVFPLFGAKALVVWMSLLPLLFHAASVFLLSLRRNSGRMGLLIYAFNPFSFISFLLNVSDGIALSSAVIGMLFLEALRDDEKYHLKSKTGNAVLSYIFLSFSILTKETFFAIPAGMIAGEFLIAAFRPADFARRIQSQARTFFFWISVTAPVLIWWMIIGYDAGKTASHAGFPLSGIIRIIVDDEFRDPMRFSLTLTFIISLIFFSANLYFFFFRGDARGAALSSVGIIACILISFADSGEYWGNFANIARLFSPLVFAFAFIRIESVPGRRLERLIFALFIFMSLKLLYENL